MWRLKHLPSGRYFHTDAYKYTGPYPYTTPTGKIYVRPQGTVLPGPPKAWVVVHAASDKPDPKWLIVRNRVTRAGLPIWSVNYCHDRWTVFIGTVPRCYRDRPRKAEGYT